MRKTAISALVLCLLLGLSVVAMAKTMTAKGAVTATTDSSITLKGKTADETYWTNDESKITKNHKKVAISDVKVGDWVEIWYVTKDGKSWITKATVKEAPKDKAMGKKGA
jgi:ABC-type enterochelin transport system substrate-binding protein